MLKKIEADIERGTFSDKDALTFARAAKAYLDGGGEDRFLAPIVRFFGDMPIDDLTQMKIDEAAVKLYPRATPATRNRQVYSPVSAILKHVGIERSIKRPKGHAGNKRVDWLTIEQVERLVDAARAIDPEFAGFLILLCYTGMRLGEALSLDMAKTHCADAFAYLPDSKNGEDRAVFLPPVVVAELANHPRGMERGGTVYRFRKNGHLYNLLKATKMRAGLSLPWITFHTFSHTYATWMRRFGGLDTRGLVGTGRWKDEKSAARYAHVVVSEESRKAILLPIPKRGGRADAV
jgi:integrase